MTVLSDVMRSNLFTMGVTSEKDPRQNIPAKPTIPNAEVRLLRARLLMEETLETCAALGVNVCIPTRNERDEKINVRCRSVDDLFLEVRPQSDVTPDLIEPVLVNIIDGCCDTIYVAIGTIAACGVPDAPFMDEVCRANAMKFPAGVATTDANGKFQKPEGWLPPRHLAILRNPLVSVDMRRASQDLVASVRTRPAASADLHAMLRTAMVNVEDATVDAWNADQRTAALRWLNAYLHASQADRPSLVNERPDFLPAPSC